MKSIPRKKAMYLLLLLVICLAGIGIKGTYAKFAAGGTTGKDIVSLNLSFNIGISNIEEYEEVVVEANDYKIFNVSIKNSSSNTAYYGVWYQMVIPSEKNDKIIIARSIDNNIQTTGSVSAGDTKVVTIIAKNNTSSTIKLNVGVSSSEKSTDSIEYLGGKKLISGTTAEADYYYDEATSKYISTTDSSITFTTDSTTYSYTGSSQTFTPNHDGAYKLEAWGAQGGSYNETYYGGYGAYAVGVIDLKKNTKLFLTVGGTSKFANNSSISGGYNGGGNAKTASTNDSAGGGGGATHITTSEGVLSSLEEKKGDIILVAGGGGGAYYHSIFNSIGGHAGGIKGSLSPDGTCGDNRTLYKGIPSNQSTAGTGTGCGLEINKYNASFGQGQSWNDWSSGGGGGYYGGGAGYAHGGNGGSSYIGNPLLTNKAMYCYNCEESTITSTKTISVTAVSTDPIANSAKKGNGAAKITPIVPTITTNSSISIGSQLTTKEIKCNDNGSGCEIVRISDTSNLNIGDHNVIVIVKDELGYRYKYIVKIKVRSEQLLLDATGGTISQGITLTNIVKNGSFENGSTNWTLNGASVTNEQKYNGTYSLKLTSPNAIPTQQLSTLYPEVNHYYYGRTMFLSSSTYQVEDCRFEWYHTDVPVADMIFAYKKSNTSTWQLLSDIGVITSSKYLSSSYTWVLRNFVVNANVDSYIDDNIIFDATKSFGSNIPNKELLDKINYFDTTTSVMIKDITLNQSYGDLPTPTKSGYTFLGWYTKITGGVKVESTTTVTNAKDHALYARWQ